MMSKSQESYVPLISLQVIMIMLSLSPMSLSLFRCTQASDSSFFVSLETLPATCFSGVDDYVMIDDYEIMFCKDSGRYFILFESI